MPSATHVIQMLSFSEQRDDYIGSAHDIKPASECVLMSWWTVLLLSWKTKPDGSATAGLDFRIFVQQELSPRDRSS